MYSGAAADAVSVTSASRTALNIPSRRRSPALSVSIGLRSPPSSGSEVSVCCIVARFIVSWSLRTQARSAEEFLQIRFGDVVVLAGQAEQHRLERQRHCARRGRITHAQQVASAVE